MAFFSVEVTDFLDGFSRRLAQETIQPKIKAQGNVVLKKADLKGMLIRKAKESLTENIYNSVLRQESAALTYLTEMIQENSGLYVSDSGEYICFASNPASLKEAAKASSVDFYSGYPFSEIDCSLTRIPIVLVFEGCDDNAKDSVSYSAMINCLMKYIEKTNLRHCVDILSVSCNRDGAYLHQTLLPFSGSKSPCPDGSVCFSGGNAMKTAMAYFEKAAEFYGQTGLMVRPPAYFFISKGSGIDLSSFAASAGKLASDVGRIGGVFAAVNTERTEYRGKLAQYVINAGQMGNERVAAYAMICMVCGACGLKKPELDLVPESDKPRLISVEDVVPVGNTTYQSKRQDSEQFSFDPSDGFIEITLKRRSRKP